MPYRTWVIRVPDVRSESFRAESHRPSLAVAESERAEEDQGFIDGLAGPSTS